VRRKLLSSLALLLPAVILPLFAGELPEVARVVLENSSSLFSLDKSSFRTDLKKLPIGVFDSGLGGLTVLARILELDAFNNSTGGQEADGVPDFALERFIYLGDQANMPYGNYPAEGKTGFLRELVLKDALFLLGKRYWPGRSAANPALDKMPVKAIVIACNTATAYGMDDLLAAVELWQVPVFVVGVVNAGARGALAGSGGEGAVAVMATVGTCSSMGYVRAVDQAWRGAGLAPPPVVQQGCLGLAGAIEGDRSYIDPAGSADAAIYRGPSVSNTEARIDTAVLSRYGFEPSGLIGDSETLRLNSVENYIRYHALSLMENYRKTRPEVPIRTVILGCTHFPFYTESFAAAFRHLRSLSAGNGSKEKLYERFLSQKINFIDPAENTAVELYATLRAGNLLLADSAQAGIQTDEFYISVPNPELAEAELDEQRAFTYGYKYGRQPGMLEIEYVKRVPMHRGNLGDRALEMIEQGIPGVWKRLVEFNRRSPRLNGVPDSLRLN